MTAARRGFRVVLVAVIVAVLVAVLVGVVAPVRVSSTPPDVVLVGDSITAGNVGLIRARLEADGMDSVRYVALSGRKIARSTFLLVPVPSGVEEVRRLRAAGVEPALWVVQLGTNDLGSIANCRCADPVAFAGDLVDEMLTGIGSGRAVAWVTVHNRRLPAASEHLNEALRRRAAVDPLLTLLDWSSRSMRHPEWFIDGRHPTLAGVDALAELYLTSFRALLDEPLGGPVVGRPPATRASHNGYTAADLPR